MMQLSGDPREQHLPGEISRWRRFLRWFRPWAKKSEGVIGRAHQLADAYAESEVAIRATQAQKYAAEAAEAAARTEGLKQDRVRVINDEIARIFSSSGLPDIAKQLQLANLLAANPDIAEQLSRIETIWKRLHLIHGTRIELFPGEDEDNTDVEDVSSG
jgi:hypothetical protein